MMKRILMCFIVLLGLISPSAMATSPPMAAKAAIIDWDPGATNAELNLNNMPANTGENSLARLERVAITPGKEVLADAGEQVAICATRIVPNVQLAAPPMKPADLGRWRTSHHRNLLKESEVMLWEGDRLVR